MSYGPSAIAVGLLTVILCQASFAEEPVSTGTVDWSGPYLGFSLATPRDGNSWRQASDGLELVPGPWQGGAMVLSLGQTWQKGSLTYGAQLSFGNGDIIARPEDAAFINCVSCATEVGNLLTLTGRVGFAMGQTQLFATGGVARGTVTTTYSGGAELFGNTAMTGWTLGIGVEQNIGDGLSIAASYDRVDLGTMAIPDYLPTGETKVDFGRMQVGMNLRW